MEIKYNINKLEKIINGLSTLTGISINLCDADGKTLIRCARKDDFCSQVHLIEGTQQVCRCSDAEIFNKCKQTLQMEHHICYAGLCDLAMPIIKKDIVVGYIIMGRIRTPLSPEYHENPYTKKHNTPFLEALYNDAPFFTYDKIECIRDLMPQILFANAIEIDFDDFITEVTEYIENHLDEKLSIDSICNKFHVSKNYLYNAFHKSFDCTVNDYISAQRLKKAIELLTETNEPIYRIAETVGIDNYTYFCKLFKRKEGISPTEYRKKHAN